MNPMRATLAGLLIVLVLVLVGSTTAAGEGGEKISPSVPVAESLRPMDPWLRNEDWTVRAVAAYDLRKRADPGAVFLAARLLAGEQHTYVAGCALTALQGRPRTDLVMEGGAPLVEGLLRFGAHEHPIVRSRAMAVLKTIPPVKLGDDIDSYKGWWSRGKTALLLEQEKLLKRVIDAKDKAELDSASVAPKSDDPLYPRIERIRKHGLELCVVMDHTGSMGPVIAAAKARAYSLITRLQAFIPKFRAGLVTYDDGARLRAPLTGNGEVLRKAFNRVGAGGGGDWEEGVDKGIRLALKQEMLGWSQRGYRVIVVVGDAPPHEMDVPGLLRSVKRARDDDMYDEKVVIHTVSTHSGGVDHFPQIALAGGGTHITLHNTGRLVDHLIMLSFGGGDRERVKAWMEEVERLRKADPSPANPGK